MTASPLSHGLDGGEAQARPLDTWMATSIMRMPEGRVMSAKPRSVLLRRAFHWSMMTGICYPPLAHLPPRKVQLRTIPPAGGVFSAIAARDFRGMLHAF